MSADTCWLRGIQRFADDECSEMSRESTRHDEWAGVAFRHSGDSVGQMLITLCLKHDEALAELEAGSAKLVWEKSEDGSYVQDVHLDFGEPRRFVLRRHEDVTGVSGTGDVAWGVVFPDGTAVLRWNTPWPVSVVHYDRGLASIEAIHGHGGSSEIVWLDD